MILGEMVGGALWSIVLIQICGDSRVSLRVGGDGLSQTQATRGAIEINGLARIRSGRGFLICSRFMPQTCGQHHGRCRNLPE